MTPCSMEEIPCGCISCVPTNNPPKRIATKIAASLRLKGISAEVDLLDRPLRKQMEAASNSKCVVIVAPKEFATNSVVIRNMNDGSERQVKLEAILNEPKSSLQL